MRKAASLHAEVSVVPDLFQGTGLGSPDTRCHQGELVAGVEMSLSDPIADLLVRVRNALNAGLDVVELPHSKLKGEVTRVLKREGYITDYAVEGGVKKTLRVYLKYTADREPAITGLKRTSKPGLRKYVSADDVPRVLGGMGVSILTTSSGIISDREAREKHVGGEVMCSVW